jgi:hypothetical protein
LLSVALERISCCRIVPRSEARHDSHASHRLP